jgi:hypothetical protein
VVADQPGRYGHSEAVEVELATRVAALHLILERPTDILQLGVARLETISDLDPVWIETRVSSWPGTSTRIGGSVKRLTRNPLWITCAGTDKEFI